MKGGVINKRSSIVRNFVFTLPAFLVLSIQSDYLGWMTAIVGVFALYSIVRFIDKFGEAIQVIELIKIMVLIQWLFAPCLYSMIYKNHLVDWQWWYLRMNVPIEEYLQLAVPSTIGILIGLSFFRNRINDNLYKQLIEQIDLRKEENFRKGLILSIIGAVSITITPYVSEELRFVFTLFSTCLYVGVIYIFYSANRLRLAVLSFFILYIVYSSLSTGMFGSLIWWPLLIIMMITIGRKFSFSFKMSIVMIALISFSLLQGVKLQYRQITWVQEHSNAYNGMSNTDILSSLLVKQLSGTGVDLMDWNYYYPIINRLNQGFHVANAMKHTPAVEPYAYGETIFTSVMATVVPRVFWPGKPKAGGKENYYRFTGVYLTNASMNIGQIGDAYVNFTKAGAPFFLLFYGIFISGYYFSLIKRACKRPTLLLWIPLLFIDIINVENDFFSTFNYAIKALLFVLFMFWLFPRLFKISL
jgi:hypothetical protein